MTQIIGLLMMIAGVALGVYVGVWVCFIGGIVDIINQVKAVEVEALGVAVGVAKIIFAGAAGSLSAFFLVIPGAAMLGYTK